MTRDQLSKPHGIIWLQINHLMVLTYDFETFGESVPERSASVLRKMGSATLKQSRLSNWQRGHIWRLNPRDKSKSVHRFKTLVLMIFIWFFLELWMFLKNKSFRREHFKLFWIFDFLVCFHKDQNWYDMAHMGIISNKMEIFSSKNPLPLFIRLKAALQSSASSEIHQCMRSTCRWKLKYINKTYWTYSKTILIP